MKIKRLSRKPLTEAAPRKTVKVDPVYNGEHDESTYFSNIRDAYKFANQLIENDKEIGLDRIYILYNYTEGYINCWVNDKRGWRNPESISTNESLKGNKSEEIMKIKRLRRVNESKKLTEAAEDTVYIVVAGRDSKVFRTREAAEKRSKQYNYNVSMSGSNDGYSYVVETTLQ